MTQFSLKVIAVLTMLIDHTGVLLFPNYISLDMYYMCRFFGRLSFPMFCFLMVEGYMNTRNRHKYMARIAAFALVAEIPYDLFVSGYLVDWRHQNVLFTLFFGFIAIYIFDRYKHVLFAVPALVFGICCVFAAEIIRVDYGWYGVLLVIILHLTRYRPIERITAVIGVALIFSGLFLYFQPLSQVFGFISLFGVLALPLMFKYNGIQGFYKPWVKWMFYAFYPVHLFLLWSVKSFLI